MNQMGRMLSWMGEGGGRIRQHHEGGGGGGRDGNEEDTKRVGYLVE